MSDSARVEMVDAAREYGEAYLARCNVRGEQQRWPLPPEGSAVTIGRAPAAEVCLSEDGQVSQVHAVLERVGYPETWRDYRALRIAGDDALGNFQRALTFEQRRDYLRARDKIRIGESVLTFCVPPQTMTHLNQQTVARALHPAVSRVTASQRSVLVALCRPFQDAQPYASPASNQQIANELFLSVDAVKTHLRVLFHKFGIEDLPQNQKRARLAQIAEESGLVIDTER